MIFLLTSVPLEMTIRCVFSRWIICLHPVFPAFLLKISPDQSFEGFHAGVKTSIKSLCTNKIVKLNRWSQLEEALRYLNSLELDQKKSVLLEQCVSLGTTKVGTLKYSSEIIVRAFEYLATSRTLYKRLRKDFGLPGLATLNRL